MIHFTNPLPNWMKNQSLDKLTKAVIFNCNRRRRLAVHVRRSSRGGSLGDAYVKKGDRSDRVAAWVIVPHRWCECGGPTTTKLHRCCRKGFRESRGAGAVSRELGARDPKTPYDELPPIQGRDEKEEEAAEAREESELAAASGSLANAAPDAA